MKIIISAVGSMPQTSLIKEFQSYGVKVIGIDCDPLSVGFEFCDKSYVVPKAIDSKFIPELLNICLKEKVNSIIISPDEEIKVISLNRRIFEAIGVKLLIPNKESIKICNDKWLTYNFFKKNNIPTPDTRIHKYIPTYYPSILKPREGRGGNGIIKVLDVRVKPYPKLNKYICQKYIKGTEYSIDVLSDYLSNPISIVIRQRVGIESGISTKGRIVYNKQMTDYIKIIVKKLGLVGMSCIQGIKDENFEIKFTEINLRFGGGSVLSRRADPTIIPNYIRLIKGQKLLKVKEPKLLSMLRYYSEVIK